MYATGEESYLRPLGALVTSLLCTGTKYALTVLRVVTARSSGMPLWSEDEERVWSTLASLGVGQVLPTCDACDRDIT